MPQKYLQIINEQSILFDIKFMLKIKIQDFAHFFKHMKRN